MRLSPNILFHGVNPSIIQECALRLREWNYFQLPDFCRAIGAPVDEARLVLDSLLTEGFVCKGEIQSLNDFDLQKIERAGIDIDDCYCPTALFRQLALASITHGLTRAEAEKLISKVLDSAVEINANPDKYWHTITKLVVFGSYLTDAPILGDVDIGYESGRIERAQEELDSCDYEEDLRRFDKMLSKLRCRQPNKISIHGQNEVIRLKTQFKVIFEK